MSAAAIPPATAVDAIAVHHEVGVRFVILCFTGEQASWPRLRVRLARPLPNRAAAWDPSRGNDAATGEAPAACPRAARPTPVRDRESGRTSVEVSPANACTVSISNSTQPNAQMSARLSTGLPRACSGPYRRPCRGSCRLRDRGAVSVGDGLSAGAVGRLSVRPPLAKPKSSTFTVPSGRTLMLAGFRSRWMMPCSCAASSASAICLAIGSASSTGMAPRAIRSASVGPSTSSMHQRRDTPRLLRDPWIAAMCG